MNGHALTKPFTLKNATFCILCLATVSASASPSTLLHHRPRAPASSSLARIVELRGGDGGADNDSSGGAPKKQKRKGKSRKKAVAASSEAKEGQADDDDGETDAKSAINDTTEEMRATTGLGDGVRQRADLPLRDRLPYPERTFDAALVSLGLSLGTAGTDKDASDENKGEEGADGVVDTALAYYQYGYRHSRNNDGQNQRQHIRPSSSAAIANYFLKSHGGTHVVQCLLSLLASALGVACLVLPAIPSTAAIAAAAAAATTTSAKTMNSKSLSRKIILSTIKYQLMQQTLLLAMAKHASALVGAVLIGASRIPQLGTRDVRWHLESVASDPVGQYMFYCSVMAVWMGWFGDCGGGGGARGYVARLRASVVSTMNASAAAAAAGATSDANGGGNLEDAAVTTQLLDTLSQQHPPWFLSQSYGGSLISILILGPILLREIVSILWVFSDVMTLAVASSGGMIGKFLSGALAGCRSILDTFMSILITPEKWRQADSFQRQRTLAGLVSRCSLAMELAVGGILMGDAVQSFWTLAFVGSTVDGSGNGETGRLPFKCVMGKMACAHLYLNFLLSRRRQIATVIGSIRGGGSGINHVLDVSIDPMKEIGLPGNKNDDET